MGQRLLLVIGSQCDSLGDTGKLRFLPELAHHLHELMTQPGLGACVGVPLASPHLPGLLIDPTVEEAKTAIESAIELASRKSATLVLAYIGHGVFPDEMDADFYLMAKNTPNTSSPNGENALHFAQFIKERLRPLSETGRLVVLLDTCHAATGAWEAMSRWATSRRGKLGYELLTATDDRRTANAPLSRAIIDLLGRGDPESGERIRCGDVHRVLYGQSHPSQHVAYNAWDAEFYLGRNIARDPGDVFWRAMPGLDRTGQLHAQIMAETQFFQPTQRLTELVACCRSHPVVVVVDDAGAGKSTLAAALVRPEITGGRVREGFVQAIALLGQATNPGNLAEDLARHLGRSVPGFEAAVAEFGRSAPEPERRRFGLVDPLACLAWKPLEHLPDRPTVRIVLDGFNQLPDDTRVAVGRALEGRPAHVHLVITTRGGTPDCPEGKAFPCGSIGPEELGPYLERRRVPEAASAPIRDKARGNWLLSKLLADAVLGDRSIDLTRLPGNVNDAFATLLDQAGAGRLGPGWTGSTPRSGHWPSPAQGPFCPCRSWSTRARVWE
jgi:hypothetical protein